VEQLTREMYEKAWKLIREIEDLGGMTKALEKGIPKLRIEEAAARKQAMIDSGKEKILGVNYLRPEVEENIPILEVDNEAVRRKQIERLERIKAERNGEAVKKALDALTEAAKTGEGNLLELAVKAAESRATLGEISGALEKVYGRYQPSTQLLTGVYNKEIHNDKSFIRAKELADEFERLTVRRPRILIAKMGQDGHDRGAKVVATAFADIGFDVDLGPLFSTPEEVFKQAVDNDVDIISVSSLAGGHKTLISDLIKIMKESGREDFMVVAGGVIPKQDYPFLFDLGVSAVYGPGTKISDAAIEILSILNQAYRQN
jgi:methylmalonyl-CoA mutase